MSATQSGVQDEGQPNAATTTTENEEQPMSARELAMQSISVKRNEEFEKESGLKLETPPEPETPTAEDEPVDQLAAQLEEPKVLSDGLDKTMVKVKIDGEEREVSIADMQREYQKNGAADKRLAEATRMLKEAQEAQARLQTEKPAEKPEEQAMPAEPTAAGKEFLAALFEGDSEKALAAFNAATAGRPGVAPTLNEAELIAKLTPALKQQLVVESALDNFAKEYADIVTDPYLARRADDLVKSKVAEGVPFEEALKFAGDDTRDWLRGKAGVKPGEKTPTISRTEKLERKAGIDEISSPTVKATPVVEPQQTTSDILKEMAKARGLTI